MDIKYRTYSKGVPPRKVKLDLPGWAGNKVDNVGQPFQCKPWVDAATYGLELIYPFDTEVEITSKNGISEFHYSNNEEWKEFKFPEGIPFQNFTPNHFGFTSSMDIQTPEGYGTMILPHPRYYTDTTGTVPLPAQGFLESDWWPKVFFIAFKAPLEGQRYVFRKGEGIAQFIFVPKEPNYNVVKMTSEEENHRSLMDKIISRFGSQIATKNWKDDNGLIFDNKYKVLSSICKKEGVSGVEQRLFQIDENQSKEEELSKLQRRNKMQRRLLRRK